VVSVCCEICCSNWRKDRIARLIASEDVCPEPSGEGGDERTGRRDADERQSDRRVERRPHERTITGPPFRRGLIENVEESPNSLERRRLRQLPAGCEELMGRIEMREDVEEEGETPGLTRKQAAHESGRPGWLDADELLPQRLGIRSAGDRN